MKNRKIILLLLLACAAVGTLDVMIYARRPEGKTARTVLVDMSEEFPSRVSIVRKGGAKTVLEQRSGHWMLSSPYAGHADDQVVLKLLDVLANTPVPDSCSDSELIRNGWTRADYSLEDPVVRVSVRFPSGRAETVGFGAPTPSAEGVYASIDGIGALFVIPTKVLAAVDVPVEGFRRRSLFLSEFAAVSSFDVKRPGSKILEFVKEGEQWRMRDSRASSEKVSRFLADLTTADAVDFVWPVGASNETARATTALLAEFGLDPDSAVTVSLRDMKGANGQVSLGKTSGDDLVYALVQDGQAIVKVRASLRDFVVQDPVQYVDTRLFPVEARTVAFFSVSDGGVLYALSRNKGGKWEIESPIVVPADQQVADFILSRMLALTSADVLAEGGVSVSVTTNDARYAVLRESVLGGRSFEDLRDKEILRIDPALVRRIVRNPRDADGKQTSVVYGRDRRVWNVENAEQGKEADANGIANVLSAVNPLTAVRIEKLKVSATELSNYGLDKPYLTVAIDHESGEAVRRNIIVGKRTKGGRYATVGSSDAVFVLSAEVVDKLSSDVVGK